MIWGRIPVEQAMKEGFRLLPTGWGDGLGRGNGAAEYKEKFRRIQDRICCRRGTTLEIILNLREEDLHGAE